MKTRREDPLRGETQNLRARLAEADETLRAIREGEVDAIVVSGSKGEQVFSLSGAETVYRMAVETMTEAVLNVSPAGRILFCNPRFAAFVGTRSEQVMGRRLTEFMRPAERLSWRALLRRAQEKPVAQRMVFQGADGRAVPVHLSAHALHQDGSVSLCLVATDLSELENSAGLLRQLREQQQELGIVNEELRVNNETLEQRVAERTAELEARMRQLRTLAEQVTRAEEQERRRIAGVLHDGLQGLLVGARYRVEAIRMQFTDPALNRDLEALTGLLDESLDVSRSLTAELCPPILNQGSLATALEWLGQWFWEKHGLTARLRLEREADVPTGELCVAIFQAVRELLFNVVKHAGVKSAHIRLRRKADGTIGVVVSDQGVGFDPAQTRRNDCVTGGFGLFSLRERLELLGCELEVDSAPGRGCRVSVLASPSVLSRASASNIAASSGPSAPAPDGRPSAPDARIRIVVADDHARK